MCFKITTTSTKKDNTYLYTYLLVHRNRTFLFLSLIKIYTFSTLRLRPIINGMQSSA